MELVKVSPNKLKKKKMLKSIYSSQKAQHEKLAYIYVEHWE